MSEPPIVGSLGEPEEPVDAGSLLYDPTTLMPVTEAPEEVEGGGMGWLLGAGAVVLIGAGALFVWGGGEPADEDVDTDLPPMVQTVAPADVITDTLIALRRSIARGTPWGETTWAETTAAKLGLVLTPRARGRPRKEIRE